METYFTGGHSIVATFADTTAGEAGLYVASRESGDILKVGNGSGDATEEFEVRTPQAVAQERGRTGSKHLYYSMDSSDDYSRLLGDAGGARHRGGCTLWRAHRAAVTREGLPRVCGTSRCCRPGRCS